MISARPTGGQVGDLLPAWLPHDVVAAVRILLAVAEPRRRQILDALAGGELPVNDIVALLGLGRVDALPREYGRTVDA